MEEEVKVESRRSSIIEKKKATVEKVGKSVWQDFYWSHNVLTDCPIVIP